MLKKSRVDAFSEEKRIVKTSKLPTLPMNPHHFSKNLHLNPLQHITHFELDQTVKAAKSAHLTKEFSPPTKHEDANSRFADLPLPHRNSAVGIHTQNT